LALTGSHDHTARLWDVSSGQGRGILRGHDAGVNSVAFSPDGYLVLSGSNDATARLWDVSSGQERSILREDIFWSTSLAFSPDGHLVLASGGWLNTARLWEVSSGQELCLLQGHDDVINSVAFSPDSRLALTGSIDKTARLWDVQTGELVGLIRLPAPILALAVSHEQLQPNLRCSDIFLLALGDESGQVSFFRVHTDRNRLKPLVELKSADR
jgi:WD40 repeat protein